MQFNQMQLRAVAFVLAETILGEARAEVAHNRIARYLRNHTGCGDGEAKAVAIDDRGLRQRKGENGEAIDKHVVGLES